MEIISQRGLDTDYKEACKADKNEAKLTAATAAKNKYKGTDENSPILQSWNKATAAKLHTSEAIVFAGQAIFLQYSLNCRRLPVIHGPPLLGNRSTANPGQMCMGPSIPQNARHLGPPFRSASSCICRPSLGLMQWSRNVSTSVMG